ncbi:hypothetical protein [Parerythrobacter lacustris]|uniref:Uncharacterized protein n=1 Tax=Parerythrobacter lacustris TaxID=2969984 RepID=A0ABT1XMQ0_9SPHN|nr:hypothetical protein [Parerythrobacter lacustris]MCR2832945.1 hypothetical protein [Parerythrobacter lacustris]
MTIADEVPPKRRFGKGSRIEVALRGRAGHLASPEISIVCIEWLARLTDHRD